MLLEIGRQIPGFLDRVGGDFARGHKEATGGIIPKVSPTPFFRFLRKRMLVTDQNQTEIDLMIDHLEIGKLRGKLTTKASPHKIPDNQRTIASFFVVPPKAEEK